MRSALGVVYCDDTHTVIDTVTAHLGNVCIPALGIASVLKQLAKQQTPCNIGWLHFNDDKRPPMEPDSHIQVTAPYASVVNAGQKPLLLAGGKVVAM